MILGKKREKRYILTLNSATRKRKFAHMNPDQFFNLISSAKPKRPLTEDDLQRLGLLELWKYFDELEAEGQEPEKYEDDEIFKTETEK